MHRIAKAVIAATVFASSAALAAGMTCSVDNGSMSFTGNTQVVSGVLMKEYRCPRGHTAWGR